MRLAIIRKRYSAFGGAERFIERLSHRLTDQKISVSILADSWAGDTTPTLQWIKTPCRGFSRAAQYVSFLDSVKKVLASQQFDIVQSHERFAGADVVRLGDGLHKAWLTRYAAGLPPWRRLLLKADPFHRLMLRLEAQIFKAPSTHFVTNSRLIYDEASTIYSVDPSRLSIIPNGVDTEFFSPPCPAQRARLRETLQLADSAFVVCAVGSGFARKGFFELTQALASLPEIILLVAGKDRLEKQLQKQVHELGLTASIRLLGPIREIRDVYWAADAFALPSLYDPSSNAVLEALACGLPVITTTDVGTGMEIKDAQAGALCDRSPPSIARAVATVQQQREQMSANARQLSLKFSQDQAINAWQALYQQIRLQKSG
jgi:UDP-glucose:(heptosyl)LPS alpha-1,3-glucosyltransferase